MKIRVTALLEHFSSGALGQKLGFVHRAMVGEDTCCQFATVWSLVCAKGHKLGWAALL